MVIALDYDDTFTADPVLWRQFVINAKERGHSVTFVTYRDSRWGNYDIESDAEYLGILTVYTAGKQKEHCFKADVWIDDSPETIVSHIKLGNCYDGCIINKDTGDIS